MNRIVKFFRDWTLPISMIIGALSYFVYRSIPFLAPTKPFVLDAISVVQPTLIFCMLFVTFCKVSPKQIRPRLWHLLLVMLQLILFGLLTYWLVVSPTSDSRLVIEGAMLCLLCPTATAAAVVTAKLGGDAGSITTYTILINIAIAVLAPALLPMAHPHAGMTFVPSFLLILSKIFPMLICPLFVAWGVKRFMPKFHSMVVGVKDLAFYLWAVSLSLAIAVTMRAIMNSNVPVVYELGIAVASAVCCVVQFAIGKIVGGKFGERICGGQALGQKNTVFIIWLGYTFLSPVTAVAGGFYSIWHNLINSWQLYKMRDKQ